MNFWYRFCFGLCRVISLFWHPVIRTTGRELIPAGNVIFCANHSAMWDPIWFLLALNSPKMVRMMAKYELSRVPVLSAIMRYFRIIFVRRGEHDTGAYEECVRAVRDEEDRLLVFIEGTRCNGEKHVRPHTGAVRMAVDAQAPIVPVFITRNKKPFCPVSVIFGQPMKISVQDSSDHAELQKQADAVLKTIYQLGGDSYADQIG